MKYETMAGQHIQNACIEATLLSIKNQCDVEFEFNGVHLTATKDNPSHWLKSEFDRILKENREKYLQSDEYKEWQKKQKEKLEQRQNIMDTSIMPTFSDIIESGHSDYIMSWLKQFTINADYIDVTYDKKYIADFLELNGFKENEHVGQDKEFFNTKENMARYIIGQVINCLRNGMPPHKVTLKFIDDYFKLND